MQNNQENKNHKDIKLIIKGNFSVLGNFNVIQGVYMYLQSLLNELGKLNFNENKRELIFTGQGPLLGYTVKLVENKDTKTITIIIK